MSCSVTIDVDYYSGAPAAFAAIDIWEVRAFLWWQFDVFIRSVTAGFDGKASVYLTRGKTYHVRARVPGKQRDVWRTINYCPYYIGMWLPA